MLKITYRGSVDVLEQMLLKNYDNKRKASAEALKSQEDEVS